MAKQNPVRQLSEAQLASRVYTLLVNAADGQRSIADDQAYPKLRRELTKRVGDLGLAVPGLVMTYPSVDALMVYLKDLGGKPERVARVQADFRDLLRELPDEPIVVSATGWTGRPSVPELAIRVRTMAPMAVKAIDQLLADQEHRHSNGGPVEPAEQEAINHLKELRSALDALIHAAEADQPLAAQADRVASLAAKGWGLVADYLRNDLAALPIAGSTMVITAAAFAFASMFLPDGAALAVAGTTGTAFGAKRVMPSGALK